MEATAIQIFVRGLVSSSYSINVTRTTAVASATCLTKLGFLRFVSTCGTQQNCHLKLLSMGENDQSLNFGVLNLETTPEWSISTRDESGIEASVPR